MAELQLMMTPEERRYLLDLMEKTLKDTQIEEHRTRTPSFREQVLQQEDLLRSLLTKVRALGG
jgi:hypothetical protein